VKTYLIHILMVLSVTGETGMTNSFTNQLPNSSFEEINPAGWERIVWGDDVQFDISQNCRLGGKCVMISSKAGGNAAWHAKVPVYPNFEYKLSGWIKAEDVISKGGKGCQIVPDFDQERTKALTGTNDWTPIEFEFSSGDRKRLNVYCLLGGWGNVSGKVWFDDLRLEPQPTERALQIDVTKTGEPISKYIYSQFIEYLGRCIYGGIWAEMISSGCTGIA